MKWRIEHPAAALLAALTLAGCVSPSPELRVRDELEPGGVFYLQLDPAAARRHFAAGFAATERGIAESAVPEREAKQGVLALFRAAAELAGVPEISAVGASSLRLADGRCSNRFAVAAGERRSGWIWRMHGQERERLAGFAALPADTVFAADFGIDFRGIVDELAAGDDGGMLKTPRPQLFMMSAAEVLKTLSGEWRIVLAAPDGTAWDDFDKYDLFLSIPDRDEALSRRLAATLTVLLPGARRSGNVIYLPELSGAAPVLVLLPRRVLFYSSPRSFDRFSDGKNEVGRNGKFSPADESGVLHVVGATLANDPDLRAALDRLPARSHGAYFINTAKLKHVFTLGGDHCVRIALDSAATKAVGSWRGSEGMIALREVAADELAARIFDLTAGTQLAILADAWLSPPAPAAEPPREDKPSATQRAELQRENAACRTRLNVIRRELAAYAKAHHGEFPPRLPVELRCGKGKYVYFGPFAAKPSAKYPLVVDPPHGAAHRGRVNVLFVDGTVRTFEFSAGSLKRLCSYLHTIYRYDEKELLRLIERASQLDPMGTKQP